jgi:TRAP-type mannitol/chloroaromatic compound transport system permease small subunit
VAALPPAADGGRPLLGAFDRHLSKLENALNLIAALAIFFVMVLGVAQIVGRTVFDVSFEGYIDFIEQGSALIAFLGIAYCQRHGGHVRLDIALRLLPKRALWAVEALGVIVAVLIESTFLNFLRAYQLGDSTMGIRLPVWPGKLMVPVALTALWLRLLLQLAGYARLVGRPDAEPIGVPVLESIVEQTRHEIDETLGRVKIPE